MNPYCDWQNGKTFCTLEAGHRGPHINEHAVDDVNHPAHYTSGSIEVIDFIEDQKLNYKLGQVIKYLSRAGKKDPKKYLEDLKKAQWYLNREIEQNEGNK